MVVNVNSSPYSEETLTAAHKHTAFNEDELRRSDRCVCMYCGYTFPVTELDQPGLAPGDDEQYWPHGIWVYDADPGQRSGTCPKCRVDALIGDASGYPVTDRAFQIAFGKRWWGETPIIEGQEPGNIEVVQIDVE